MEIALYVFSVMYSPGPVNILGFNAGLTGSARDSIGFCLGVGAAMFTWFLVSGYLGEALTVVYRSALPYIALAGGTYILYFAYKMLLSGEGGQTIPLNRGLRFRDGYLVQLLNPKGMVVILPVTTVMFPAAHITGVRILVCSALIAAGAVGGPGSYWAAGFLAGRRIQQTRHLRLFNSAMGVMLVMVALSIIYDFFIKT